MKSLGETEVTEFLTDCLRLRVKDIAFELGQIVVRDTKGEHQRITILPDETVAGFDPKPERQQRDTP